MKKDLETISAVGIMMIAGSILFTYKTIESSCSLIKDSYQFCNNIYLKSKGYKTIFDEKTRKYYGVPHN